VKIVLSFVLPEPLLPELEPPELVEPPELDPPEVDPELELVDPPPELVLPPPELDPPEEEAPRSVFALPPHATIAPARKEMTWRRARILVMADSWAKDRALRRTPHGCASQRGGHRRDTQERHKTPARRHPARIFSVGTQLKPCKRGFNA
jgi:hypothetical protein